MRSRILFAVLALIGLLAPAARADVKPHALFSDGMVLQQGVKCPVWGSADADESVSISFEAKDQGIQFQSQVKPTNGTWRVDLPVLKAGGPYTLTIKGNNTITISDILVGEVWVASGQSNMQW